MPVPACLGKLHNKTPGTTAFWTRLAEYVSVRVTGSHHKWSVAIISNVLGLSSPNVLASVSINYPKSGQLAKATSLTQS